MTNNVRGADCCISRYSPRVLFFCSVFLSFVPAALLRQHLNGVLALEGVSDPKGSLVQSAITTCAGVSVCLFLLWMDVCVCVCECRCVGVSVGGWVSLCMCVGRCVCTCGFVGLCVHVTQTGREYVPRQRQGFDWWEFFFCEAEGRSSCSLSLRPSGAHRVLPFFLEEDDVVAVVVSDGEGGAG